MLTSRVLSRSGIGLLALVALGFGLSTSVQVEADDGGVGSPAVVAPLQQDPDLLHPAMVLLRPSVIKQQRSAFGAGTAPYTTGFEDPPFVLGPIDTQDGWEGNTDLAEISAAMPDTGSQHLRLSFDAGQVQGPRLGAFSPDLGDFSATPATVSVRLKISATGGADYEVTPQAPSQGLVTTRVVFAGDGTIDVLDDIGNGAEFVDTGFTWTPGAYFTVTIDFDPCGVNDTCSIPANSTSTSFTVSINGGQIYSFIGIPFATAIEEVSLNRTNDKGTDTGDYDNFSHTVGTQCPGACCDPTVGLCTSTGSEDDCIAAGGTFQGPNTTCCHCACGKLNSSNDCLVPSPDFTPGCTDLDCCVEACTDPENGDAFCCTVEWDNNCSNFANSFCDIYDCNGTANSPDNDCCNPAMDDPGNLTGPTVVSIAAGGSVLLDFDNTLAETDGPNDETNPCSSAANDSNIWADLWYVVNSPVNGELTITTCTLTDHDTKIIAYGPFDSFDPDAICDTDTLEGNTIECNEDCPEDGTFFSSRLAVGVEAGKSYVIRLGAFDPDAEGMDEVPDVGPGEIGFSLVEAPASANDCGGALAIDDGSTLYSTVDLTTTGPLVDGCGDDTQVNHDSWFLYTASATGGLRVDTCGTNGYDTKIAVYDTGDCGLLEDAGTTVSCNDNSGSCPDGGSNLIMEVVQGQQYLMRIGGSADGDQGISTVTITPACDVTPLGIAEGEPCGDDTSGGCNANGLPEDFVPLNNLYETPVQFNGIAWADSGARDTDWYTIETDFEDQDPTPDGRAKVCYHIRSEFPLGIGVVDALDDCAGEFVFGVTYGDACESVAAGEHLITDLSPAGAYPYGIFVAAFDQDLLGGVFDDYPCGSPLGNDYTACVTVVDFTDDCPTEEECFGEGAACGTPGCPQNLNQDGPGGNVNAADLAQLLGAWCTTPGCATGECADLNGDGVINAADLAQLLGAWGPCP